MGLVLFLLLSVQSQAEPIEQWRCVDQSTTRTGKIWMACGVGESTQSEADARSQSMKNAIDEFKQMCDLSTDCKERDRSVEPKRTACTPIVSPHRPEYIAMWKCYRLIQITVN